MVNIAIPVGLFLAQNGKYAEPIVTDRPDFTESAVTVPLKSLQLEMGLTHEWAGDDRTLGFPEALLRYGIAPSWEARLGLPNRVLLDSPGGREAGWGDTYAGFKVQLGPIGAYDVAIIGAAFLPTGNPGFNAGAIEPEIKFCVGRGLSPTEGLSGMIYTSWPDSNRRATQLQLTLTAARSAPTPGCSSSMRVRSRPAKMPNIYCIRASPSASGKTPNGTSTLASASPEDS